MCRDRREKVVGFVLVCFWRRCEQRTKRKVRKKKRKGEIGGTRCVLIGFWRVMEIDPKGGPDVRNRRE